MNKLALTPHSRSVCLRHYEFHIFTHMTLTFDLWPWKPLQQFPVTWWIFLSSYIEIPASKPNYGPVFTDGQHTAGRTTRILNAAYCWKRRHKLLRWNYDLGLCSLKLLMKLCKNEKKLKFYGLQASLVFKCKHQFTQQYM